MRWIIEQMKPKNGCKEYKFNDFPFNTMTWISGNAIEATFNVGNPKQGDVIVYKSKLGTHRFEITAYEYNHDLYHLLVRDIDYYEG